ncbi:hypothetical protein P3T76_013652 [Phytophthora citrophthora]|uniref:EF-hand domain-containing protein n=1 Tax=Phytophthora citrophthora TaxID=4793 RepID=A0AAD9LBS9_9STRA|nr:hypothetical protein P3T76_013652 [Phytophthora citrophthora]
MGRQRRGVLGCTNLPSVTHNCEARTAGHHLPRQRPSSGDTRSEATQLECDNGVADRRQLQPARREKFKLPLISSSSTGGTAIQGGQCKTKSFLSPQEALVEAKQVLGESIDSHETNSKSYKNDHWYSSPIGCGSRKAVLLAALKSRDPGGSGFITCKQLVDGLQAPNFGLDAGQARALLAEFDDQLKEDSRVPYRSFVKQLQLSEERPNQPGQDPTLFYQESYITRVRAHAATLIEKVATTEMASEHGSPRESVPAVLAPLPGTDGDRFSFEFDKERKQQRAEAKSRILLAHINRIEAFSQHEQKLKEQHETLRLATKALHRHSHFEQAFEEENRRLRIAQRQPKGMLGSPTAMVHHNVSKDSMFYVEPL